MAPRSLLALAAVLACAGSATAATPPTATSALPVIDMHLHTSRVPPGRRIAICPGDQSPEYRAVDPRSMPAAIGDATCASPILSARNGGELRDETIAELRRHNVRRALLAGRMELVTDWVKRAPGQFIPATAEDISQAAELQRLERLHRVGGVAVFAEIAPQYDGTRADDPRLEPFWALAERLDVPVGIHLGEGMPGQGSGRDRYRVALTTPFQLEAVLLRHPKLRLYVMHAASPLTDEMIAMLFEYPQLYVDIAANVWNMPRAQFYSQLKQLVDAGYSSRILFGSDQTLWPQAIGISIATIEQAPFLSERQKRDILYNNAARFLRLTPAQIAADHAPAPRP